MKLITLNINGLKSQARQSYLQHFIKQQNPDIISLQETNINNIDFISDEYDAIINNNIENYISGTIIIYKKDLELQKVKKSPEGRIIRAEFKDCIIVNIYAPTQNESNSTRKNFFQVELPNFIKANDNNIILMGDFNSIIHENDREGKQKRINHYLKNFIENLNFKDSFKLLHPNQISYTFISPNGKSRIDRIYVSSSLKSKIKEISHENYVFSDHAAVILKLENNNIPKRSNKTSYWKLNVSIFEEEEFKKKIKKFCTNAKTKKLFYQNILDWWELEIKENFKTFAQNYSKEKSKDEKKHKFFIKNV